MPEMRACLQQGFEHMHKHSPCLNERYGMGELGFESAGEGKAKAFP
jgi:hypothetical protein